MDFEAPVDAWYVWVGVALVSVALTGIVLSLPTQPAPDADRAANTADRVAGSTQRAAGSYEHDADEVKLGTKTISMRNDAGTSHASIAFGSLTPIHAIEDDQRRRALARILHGENPSRVLNETGISDEAELAAGARVARARIDEEGAEWRPAGGTLHIRKLSLDGQEVVLAEA